MMRLAVVGWLVGVGVGCVGSGVRGVGVAMRADVVEVRGVGAAGDADWAGGRVHFVGDVRGPLMEPGVGRFRNIYAPSVVALASGGYRIFYGGWDGVATGNDRIYSVVTDDFLTFRDRRVVVEHGGFQHVCNVSAVLEKDGGFRLFCTGYPDAAGLNKVVSFRVPAEGTGPVVAGFGDLISMGGYSDYAGGDLNGMNPVMMRGGRFEMYFADFKRFGHVWRAGSGDGKSFQLEGEALAFEGMPNDVKEIGLASGGGLGEPPPRSSPRVRGEGGRGEGGGSGRRLVLMGLHRNGGELYYAVSRDGVTFGGPKVLAKNLGEGDRYMVAVGFVVKEGRVLGFLYGAGAVPSLDRNRIYARWLQRRVVLVGEDGVRVEGGKAWGPDRVLLEVTGKVRGRVEVYGEDGETLLYRSGVVEVEGGRAYEVKR